MDPNRSPARSELAAIERLRARPIQRVGRVPPGATARGRPCGTAHAAPGWRARASGPGDHRARTTSAARRASAVRAAAQRRLDGDGHHETASGHPHHRLDGHGHLNGLGHLEHQLDGHGHGGSDGGRCRRDPLPGGPGCPARSAGQRPCSDSRHTTHRASPVQIPARTGSTAWIRGSMSWVAIPSAYQLELFASPPPPPYTLAPDAAPPARAGAPGPRAPA
jgi:hypothetical protein